tara:strand:- start:2164 stop:3093 length:930 start_codon:yes stop_codon:yes gene_type:complete
MAKLLKLRRGSTIDHGSFIGAEGEVTIDTDKDTAVVHDGLQQGGRPLLREDCNNLPDNAIPAAKIGAGTLPLDVNATTQSAGDNSSKIATTAYADTAVTDLNASNISSGTIDAARVPTLNQNTTGNAATATALATARNISGASFDGTADITLNNSNITNGANYTTYSSDQATDTTSNVNFASVTASGDITAFSDQTLKKDIATINDALSLCGKLRGVSYKWIKDDKPSIGVIAQEIEAHIPEVVSTTQLDGADVKSVDYGKIVGVLINAVNELKAELDQYKGTYEEVTLENMANLPEEQRDKLTFLIKK